MNNHFLIFTKKELYYIIAIFILGIITGAALLNLYISQEIDQLILEKNTLTNKVESQQKQIEKLTKNLQQQKKHIITGVTFHLNSNTNKHIEQEIEKKLSDLLDSLIGKEMDNIDPHLIKTTINEREISIEDDKYILEFDWLILKEEIELFIEVEKQ